LLLFKLYDIISEQVVQILKVVDNNGVALKKRKGSKEIDQNSQTSTA
jgi:hypothetical protein